MQFSPSLWSVLPVVACMHCAGHAGCGHCGGVCRVVRAARWATKEQPATFLREEAEAAAHCGVVATLGARRAAKYGPHANMRTLLPENSARIG